MSQTLLSVLALLVTLGVLVTFHEYGHFWVARRLGVKVLRFSVGFGKPLWLRRGRVDNTEYVIAAIPLGGYVKMLDEREGEVDPAELHRAFNRQSVWVRIAIVIAGPLFNFIFAALAFGLMYVVGVNSTRPLLDRPLAESIAEAGGFKAGDLILRIGDEQVQTLQDALLALVDQSMARVVVAVEVRASDDSIQQRSLDLRVERDLTEQGHILSNLGLSPWQPPLPAAIGQIIAEGAAEQAGLQVGDEIVAVDGEVMRDWQHWAATVRAKPGESIQVDIQRGSERISLPVTPAEFVTEQGIIGRVGAGLAIPSDLDNPARFVMRYGPLQALGQGVIKTWDMSIFTLRMLGRMLIGQASLKNISGPVTIAQYAGQSAAIGWAAFLTFLALVSISLGVLNLLPIPMLDGGHLLYYCIELIKGSPLSENAEYTGQRIGLTLIVMLMGLALFNDVVRLIS